MKRNTLFFVGCLVMFFTAATAFAQVGFTGQQGFGGFTGTSAFTPPQGSVGQQSIGWPQGFTGQFIPVSVAQVYSFPNKAPAILRGNIVQFLGGDRYLFRDATGDIIIKIKHDRWWGLSVGPNDLVELGGELKRDKKTWMINYFDAKTIRMAL